MLRLSQYQMNVKYVTQKCVPIADCMSRLINSETGVEDPTLNLQITDITKTNVNWDQIKLSCLDDPTMIQLACIIQRAWPDTVKDVPVDVKPYFQYHYILHIVNGVIFLQDRIVVPMGLRSVFLQKIHEAHLGIVKSKLLGRTLFYWPNWNSDVKATCQNCSLCRENQAMPANVPKFQVKANSPGEIYGIDVAEINGQSHIVCVDYFTCCIFKRELRSLHSADVIDTLKSIFCDIGAPDRIISNNVRYFTSEEFQDFTMKWSIQHVTLSPHFPHGNAHAEKAVHVVKQIYLKADDVKLALLLLKTMPISNNKKFIQEAPANVFYGPQLKAHLPVKRKPTVLQNFYDDTTSEAEIPSKYNIGEEIWVKLDSNSKWMPGKIEQVLPNQSYTIKMVDGWIFRRNEHHITV